MHNCPDFFVIHNLLKMKETRVLGKKRPRSSAVVLNNSNLHEAVLKNSNLHEAEAEPELGSESESDARDIDLHYRFRISYDVDINYRRKLIRICKHFSKNEATLKNFINDTISQMNE